MPCGRSQFGGVGFVGMGFVRPSAKAKKAKEPGDFAQALRVLT